jgi:hypothetical protein
VVVVWALLTWVLLSVVGTVVVCALFHGAELGAAAQAGRDLATRRDPDGQLDESPAGRDAPAPVRGERVVIDLWEDRHGPLGGAAGSARATRST